MVVTDLKHGQSVIKEISKLRFPSEFGGKVQS